MNPAPLVEVNDKKESQETLSIAERWRKHQQQRADLLKSGKSEEDVQKMGFDALTLDQYIQKYGKLKGGSEEGLTPEQSEARQDNISRRLVSLRMAKDLEAYHNQGKEANPDGFNMTGKPSIMKISTDALRQNLYMFSPEWQKAQGASGMSDMDLMAELAGEDSEEAQKIKAMKEA